MAFLAIRCKTCSFGQTYSSISSRYRKSSNPISSFFWTSTSPVSHTADPLQKYCPGYTHRTLLPRTPPNSPNYIITIRHQNLPYSLNNLPDYQSPPDSPWPPPPSAPRDNDPAPLQTPPHARSPETSHLYSEPIVSVHNPIGGHHFGQLIIRHSTLDLLPRPPHLSLFFRQKFRILSAFLLKPLHLLRPIYSFEYIRIPLLFVILLVRFYLPL